MFPTSEQLEEIAALHKGKLEDVPFAVLLRALAVQRRSCTLEIQRKRMQKRIAIESGVPVACESNLVHERFGPFLVGIERLSDTEFATSFSESITRDVPLGEVLVEKKLVSLEELYKLLQQCLAKQLLDGFTWTDGEFILSHDEMDVHAPLKVKVQQLILTGVMRFAPQTLVDGMVMTLIGQSLALHPWPKPPLEQLRLDKCSGSLVKLLAEKTRPLSDLAEKSGLPIEEVSRSVYALGMVGQILTAESLEVLESPGEITQPVPQLQFTPRSELSKDEVMRVFLAHRRLDPFQLLGLDEEATLGEIEEGWVEFARQFSPWRFEGGPLAAVREQAGELFLAGARGYAELADTERRESVLYRRRLRAEEAEREKRTGPARIQTELLDPEAQYKKGHQLVASGAYEQALEYLEFASDCDPQNGLYRAELAYCRYLKDPKSVEEQLHHLAETHRIDPGCGLAYLYAGELVGHLGQYDRAEALLREASKLMAPDRRAIDKLKELASSRKKAK